MKMNRHQKINFAKKLSLILLLITSYGCDSFVEVNEPSGQLTTTSVFKDRATADAAVLNIYANLRDSGMLTGNNLSLTIKMGAYADELDFYGINSSSTLHFYNNTLLPTNAQIASWWKTAYFQIYAANSVIKGVSDSAQLSTEEKNHLIGDALFIRSLLHFYLMNLYGKIPYVISTDYIENSKTSRSDTSLLYTKIKEDLLSSYSMLPENYLTPDRTRPNKATAMALLARVYLYSEEWDKAENAASSVIDKVEFYKWESDLNKIFLKGSTTTIWQYKPAIEGQNSAEGGSLILIATPPSEVALTAAFVNAFEANDQRRQNWIGSITGGSSVWYFSNKYKNKLKTTSSLEYSIQFRLAEQYLIRAEARAHQNDLTGAREDLNKIRHNACLNNTTAISQNEILERIREERLFELFTESGHRFFDLKRWGQLDVKLKPVKNGWDSTDNLLPVPESEIILNPNLLPQNPGY